MSDASGTSEFEDGAPGPPVTAGHKAAACKSRRCEEGYGALGGRTPLATGPHWQSGGGDAPGATHCRFPLPLPGRASGPNRAPQVEIGSGGNPARKVWVGSRGPIRTARRDIDPWTRRPPKVQFNGTGERLRSSSKCCAKSLLSVLLRLPFASLRHQSWARRFPAIFGRTQAKL